MNNFQSVVKPRFVVAVVGIVVVGALMGLEVVSSEAGMAVIISILAAVGVYDRRQKQS